MVTAESLPHGHRRDRRGFTVVEVLVAVVILAFGLLGMGGVTVVMIRQIEAADVATERSAALQTTLEHLRSLPYQNVVTGSDSVGAYQVSWTVSEASQWKMIEIVTQGPGLGSGGSGPAVLSPSVADTFTFSIVRP
jgi:prepilin-type N-terminal cleavage/methylation domain-containing protein